jgi:hypothetical protein
MFKIRNLKKGKVIIGDLGLSIKGYQEMDLDSRFTRSEIEGSRHLKIAIQGEYIEVIEKTEITPISSSSINTQNIDLDKLLNEKIANLSGLQNTQNLESKLDKLLSAFQNGLVPAKNSIDDDLENQLEADKQVDIHSKAIERLRKNAEGRVDTQKEQVESDASDRANELEDFI